MMIYVLDRVENIVGKGENAGYQHFLLSEQSFQKPSCPRSLKVGIVWERGNQRVTQIRSCITFKSILNKSENATHIF